jgi:hypothetical protein
VVAYILVHSSWLALAENRFQLNGVDDDQARLDLLVSSLSKDSLSRVDDVVENPRQLRSRESAIGSTADKHTDGPCLALTPSGCRDKSSGLL